ncbi:Uncharacterised protein [Serratia fonticola]|nr:Uncharacterised protein [Serratia fonticola]
MKSVFPINRSSVFSEKLKTGFLPVNSTATARRFRHHVLNLA